MPFNDGWKLLLRYKEIGIPLGCEESVERFIKLSPGGISPNKLCRESTCRSSLRNPPSRENWADLRRMKVILVPKRFYCQAHDLAEGNPTITIMTSRC